MAINISYPVIDMERTGENIKQLREERNISMLELQHYLGFTSPQAIYQWQNGTNLPTVDNLCALSHLFGISMNEILVLKKTNWNVYSSTKQRLSKFQNTINNTIMMLAA